MWTHAHFSCLSLFPCLSSQTSALPVWLILFLALILSVTFNLLQQWESIHTTVGELGFRVLWLVSKLGSASCQLCDLQQLAHRSDHG